MVHKGECGVCTEDNVCAKPNSRRPAKKSRAMGKRYGKRGGKRVGKRRGQLCDVDGNRVNRCEAQISVCEAAKNGNLIPEFKRKCLISTTMQLES